MKLKVCGMKYENNIKELELLAPDFMGFIFYEKSPRYVEEMLPLKKQNGPKRVGVFVNQSLEFIQNKIKEYEIDIVQLHGKESPEFCEHLKRIEPNIEIIKVFAVLNQFDFEQLTPYEVYCDYFLFDTKGPNPGGNSFVFDWKILEDYNSSKPFFLSGGIGLEELNDLREFMSSEKSKLCYAIDVNSKFEIEPGLKDLEKIKIFKEKL